MHSTHTTKARLARKSVGPYSTTKVMNTTLPTFKTDYILTHQKRTGGPSTTFNKVQLIEAITLAFDTLDVRFHEVTGMNYVRAELPFVFEEFNHDLPFLSAHEDELIDLYAETLSEIPIKKMIFDPKYIAYTNGILHTASNTFISTAKYVSSGMTCVPLDFVERDWVPVA